MKSLLELLDCLFHDGRDCCPAVERERDMSYVRKRVSHEGLSFLTITLPSLCDCFDRSLSEGKWLLPESQSFATKGCLPAFLQGFTSLVFDKRTGELLREPDPCTISLIRQILRLFKKIELDCSPKRLNAAFRNFKEIDNVVSNEPTCKHRRIMDYSILLDNVLFNINSHILTGTILPRHGPGAVAIPSKQNAKFRSTVWSDRLQHLFPADRYLLPCGSLDFHLEQIDYQEPGAETPVRVVSVPKTMKTPRIIAIEPTHMQFMQQGLKDRLYEDIESDPFIGGQVNFTNQQINQDLAKQGSITGKYATIDLSEASDRVSMGLVKAVFHKYPYVLEALFVTRSKRASVPIDGEIQTFTLNKFASMGSALCFPIESLCFYVICVMALCEAEGTSVTPLSMHRNAKKVFVYGDDIIVPQDKAETAMSYLEAFGLKVNQNKSFYKGFFRESCGGDFYKGTDVKPVYLRELPPHSRRESKQVSSWVSLANQLYRKGYWQAADHARRTVEHAVGLTLPTVPVNFAGLGWQTFLPKHSTKGARWNDHLHRLEVKSIGIESIKQRDEIDGIPALTKCLSKRGELPFEDKDHLIKSARRGHVTTKVRWFPLF